MDTQLIDLYKKYEKKGKLYEFTKYINDNDLTQKFIQQLFSTSFMKKYEGKEYDEAMGISNFALMLTRDILEEKFGDNLSKKIIEILYNIDEPFSRNVKLLSLVAGDGVIATDENSRRNLEAILDMTSNPENVYGIHVIGAQIGDERIQSGIPLTGHKFVAVDRDFVDYSKNIETVLKKNITLFQSRLFNDSQIDLLIQLINSRNYNSPSGQFNDILITSIPRSELEGNAPGIIIERDGDKFLNPEYIKCFARVDVRDGRIEDVVRNSKFIEKSNIPQSMQEWNAQFEEWYEKSRQLQIQPHKQGLISLFKRIREDRYKGDQTVEQDQGFDKE